MERAFERFALTRAFNRGGVLDSPMRAHRPARPDRACLARRIIADGEDEVEAGRAGLREFVPAFRAQVLRFKAKLFEQGKRLRVDIALRGAASADRKSTRLTSSQ